MTVIRTSYERAFVAPSHHESIVGQLPSSPRFDDRGDVNDPIRSNILRRRGKPKITVDEIAVRRPGSKRRRNSAVALERCCIGAVEDLVEPEQRLDDVGSGRSLGKHHVASVYSGFLFAEHTSV